MPKAAGRHRVAALGILLLGAAGCFSPILADRFDVARKLEAGQSEELVLVVLRERGEIDVTRTAHRPPSGRWGDLISNNEVLGALLVGEARSGRRVEKMLRVERFWGFQGWEVYHLFFDDQDRLVAYHRRIL